MKKLLLPALFSLLSLSLQGQNWNLFRTGETYNFNQSNIHGIRVDSMHTSNVDTSYFFNHILNDSVNNNFLHASVVVKNIVRPNILGMVAIKRGDSVFFQSFDSLQQLLLPTAPLGSTWTFAQSPTIIFESTIDSVYQDSVNGMLDSIKIVRFKALDSSRILINHSINQDEIVLSKKNGILKTFNLFEFNSNYLYSNRVIDYDRIFDRIDITRGQMFDFNVGDKYHIRINEGDNAGGFYIPDYVNAEVVNKRVSLNSDTIVYRLMINRERNYTTGGTGPGDPIVFHQTFSTNFDSLVIVNPNQAYLSIVGQEPLIYDSVVFGFNAAQTYHLSINQYNRRLKVAKNDDIYMYDTFFQSWVIAFGLGDTHISVESVCSFVDEYRSLNGSGTQYYRLWNNLIYFRKGTETWGTPRIVTGVETNSTSSNHSLLFPNPTSGVVQLQTSKRTENIQVFDLKGKKLLDFATPLNLSNKEIELPQPAGMYLLRIQFQDGTVLTKKVIKE